MKPQEITFKADKKHRDRYFSAGSFAHPAKMMLPLQRWIIERYSRPGDVILDPMAGQGTLLIACTMGRHIILVELESKFVQMQEDNWTKIQTLGPEMGYEMGTATIMQGDARKLPDVLADAIISSPPYGNRLSDVAVNDGDPQRMGYRQALADVVISSPPYAETLMADQDGGKNRVKRLRASGHNDIADRIEIADNWHQHEADYNPDNPSNIGNLPYGKLADVIMTSPPYASQWGVSDNNRPKATFDREQRHKERHPDKYRPPLVAYSESMDNLGNLPYGNIDCVITSPPYETPMKYDGENKRRKIQAGQKLGQRDDVYFSKGNIAWQGLEAGYGTAPGNIGNLKGESYLSAMLEVYQGCWRVLKPQGLMILVTKNFIREKQEVRLDLDTIKLCEQAGFQFIERHYRKLTSQSFWRTIYQQKYPDAPVLDKEDILVFKKLWRYDVQGQRKENR